ncbi:MAG TPA: enoyl-CoA hydratase-related protein, partial [Solirubrobacteraceae bacterium]|nr:enoyl-CoA hydratase-related protein [Solirubrobacteraceae bacterium]
EMTKPTIAQINGGCIGGAMELALACDMRVMAADALIGLLETRVGLIPDVGGSSRLPAVIGLGRAKEMVMASRLIDGTEAERIGLVNRVAPADRLEAATEMLVGELLLCAPLAVGLAKRVMDAAAKPALAETLEQEAVVQELCARSEDFSEGAAAVAEKRPPAFRGS